MTDVSILDWVKTIITAVAGFFIVYRSTPLLIKVAFVKNLYDKPDGERKVHTDYINNLGGIALYLAIGYLYHNFHLANIFMKDTGSMIFGFVYAIPFFDLVIPQVMNELNLKNTQISII